MQRNIKVPNIPLVECLFNSLFHKSFKKKGGKCFCQHTLLLCVRLCFDFKGGDKGIPKTPLYEIFQLTAKVKGFHMQCTHGKTTSCRFQREKAALGNAFALYMTLQLRSASEAFKFSLLHLQILPFPHSLTQESLKVLLDSLLNQSISF